MKPTEKAEELVLKFLRLQEKESTNWFHKGLAKQCAFIAVEEIIKSQIGFIFKSIYWQKVKQEIEKL